MTYQEAYQKATGELKAAGIPEPESDSWILLEHVTGMTRTRYYVDGFERMPKNEEDRFFELVSCRKTRIPVQHLTGVQEFMGYEFAVNEHVLVPRQDTEILVEEAEKRLLLMKKENPVKVLDMCTGSGCILLSVALERKLSKGIGVDISGKALAVAKANQEALAPENVTLIQSDLFENAGKYLMEQSVDIVVSNPPYICTEVIDSLSEEVRLHDPVLALDGHEDGLYFYRKITKQAKSFLKPGGRLFYEIGYDQSAAVEALLCKEGYTQVSTVKDLAGLDRVVMGRL